MAGNDSSLQLQIVPASLVESTIVPSVHLDPGNSSFDYALVTRLRYSPFFPSPSDTQDSIFLGSVVDVTLSDAKVGVGGKE